MKFQAGDRVQLKAVPGGFVYTVVATWGDAFATKEGRDVGYAPDWVFAPDSPIRVGDWVEALETLVFPSEVNPTSSILQGVRRQVVSVHPGGMFLTVRDGGLWWPIDRFKKVEGHAPKEKKMTTVTLGNVEVTREQLEAKLKEIELKEWNSALQVGDWGMFANQRGVVTSISEGHAYIVRFRVDGSFLDTTRWQLGLGDRWQLGLGDFAKIPSQVVVDMPTPKSAY